jgi:ABC-type transport system involved in multi-copper enzyme maturation permease subunit
MLVITYIYLLIGLVLAYYEVIIKYKPTFYRKNVVLRKIIYFILTTIFWSLLYFGIIAIMIYMYIRVNYNTRKNGNKK